MENKHTPGQWTVEQTKCAGFRIQSAADIVCWESRTGYPPLPKDEAQANARLIAAAPDLLRLCKDSYDALRDIINSADNNHPYSARELENSFNDTANDLYGEIREHEPGFE